MTLSNSQIRYLKTQAHHLNPVVTVADKGLADTVLEELNLQLDHHELIKVKLRADREQRNKLATGIAEQTSAELINLIGGVAIYFRRNSEAPKLALPE